jgi:hypothetical protein
MPWPANCLILAAHETYSGIRDTVWGIATHLCNARPDVSERGCPMDASKLLARGFSLAFIALAASLALMIVLAPADPIFAG